MEWFLLPSDNMLDGQFRTWPRIRLAGSVAQVKNNRRVLFIGDLSLFSALGVGLPRERDYGMGTTTIRCVWVSRMSSHSFMAPGGVTFPLLFPHGHSTDSRNNIFRIYYYFYKMRIDHHAAPPPRQGGSGSKFSQVALCRCCSREGQEDSLVENIDSTVGILLISKTSVSE